MTKVTAENLTDEQIRDLRQQAIAVDDVLTAGYCFLALRADRTQDVSDAGRAHLEPDIAKARERCVAIINARSKETP